MNLMLFYSVNKPEWKSYILFNGLCLIFALMNKQWTCVRLLRIYLREFKFAKQELCGSYDSVIVVFSKFCLLYVLNSWNIYMYKRWYHIIMWAKVLLEWNPFWKLENSIYIHFTWIDILYRERQRVFRQFQNSGMVFQKLFITNQQDILELLQITKTFY